MRPLTLKRPKPVLPLVGKPFIAYMLDWLREHGVDEVVMACGFEPDALRETIGSGDAGQRVRYVVEPDPRGTAGAIRFAKEELQERFFVLNGDVLCETLMTALMNEHTSNQALATSGSSVSDATGYPGWSGATQQHRGHRVRREARSGHGRRRWRHQRGDLRPRARRCRNIRGPAASRSQRPQPDP